MVNLILCHCLTSGQNQVNHHYISIRMGEGVYSGLITSNLIVNHHLTTSQKYECIHIHKLSGGGSPDLRSWYQNFFCHLIFRLQSVEKINPAFYKILILSYKCILFWKPEISKRKPKFIFGSTTKNYWSRSNSGKN